MVNILAYFRTVQIKRDILRNFSTSAVSNLFMFVFVSRLFFGLKLHFIINDKGEILDFVHTPGNVDDRKPPPDPDKRIMKQQRELCPKLKGR